MRTAQTSRWPASALLLGSCCLAFLAAAGEAEAVSGLAKSFSVQIGHVQGQIGGTVEVPVSLGTIPANRHSLDLVLGFDPQKLAVTETTLASDLAGTLFASNAEVAGRLTVGVACSLPLPADSRVFTVRFAILTASWTAIPVALLKACIDEEDQTGAVLDGSVTVQSAPVMSQGESVTVAMDEDGAPQAFALSLTATDPDGEPLDWSVTAPPHRGVAGVVGADTSAELSFSPPADWSGSTSFAVTVTDPRGGMDTITVNVTISPRNDPPSNTLAPSVAGTHHAGRTLTAVDGIWDDAADLTPGTLSYTRQWRRADDAAGLNAADIGGATGTSHTLQAADNGKCVCLRVTATDDGEGLPAAQSTSAVSAWTLVTNAAPAITQGASVAQTMDEDGAPLGWSAPTLDATDADGDTLTWSKASDPAQGTATVAGTGASPTTFTYSPTPNWNGIDSFEVQVADPYGGTDTITVNVMVSPLNDPPSGTLAPSVTGTHHPGQTLTAVDGIWDDAADLTPGTLSYTRQWRRADGAGGLNAADIGGATGTTYVLQAADSGKHVCVRVTATDNGEGLPAVQSTSAASAWTLVTNAAPGITQGASIAQTMDEDGAPLAWSAPMLEATDADSDTLTWSKASDPAHGAATVAGTGASPTTFTYAPTADWNGGDSFVVQVADPYGGTDSITVQVTVNPRNDPPVITEQSALTVREGSSVEVRLADLVVTDPDNTYPGDFTLRVLAGANYAAAGDAVTPYPGFTGILAVPVTVNDGDDDSAPFGIAITVLARLVPTITWAAPSAIVYGTALSATQLCADADTPGTLIYDPPVGTVLNADAHDLTVAFVPTDGVNWAAGGASVPLTVEKASLTATGQNALRPYGDGNPTLVVVCTGYVNGDDDSDLDTAPSVTCGATPASPAGAYAIVPAGGADSNYTFAYVDGTLTVDPVPLTCAADDKSRAYGNPNPALTVRYVGLKNGQTAPATPPTAACAANEASAVGDYPITLSGGADLNYALSLVPGTLTIGKADQTISFAGTPEKTYGDAPFTVPATATSGLPPTLSSSNENVATIEAGRGDWTVTIKGAGSTVLTATQLGDGNWKAASAVQRTLAVARAALTVTANSVVRRVGQPNPTFTCAATGLQNGDTLESIGLVPAYACAAEDTSTPGPYAVTPSGPATTANYTVAYLPGTLMVTSRQAPVITWAAPSAIVYGTAVSATQLCAVADASGTLIYDPPVGTVLSAGTHALAVTFTPDDAATWTSAIATVFVDVTRAVLTVTADSQTKPFGAELPPLTATWSGFVNGDDTEDLDAPVALSTTATATSDLGAYPIAAMGASGRNYNVTHVSGTLTVVPASHTVRFLAGANGNISGPTAQTVLSRCDALPVTAVPSYMYVFRQWSDGSTACSRTETDVTEDRAFTASFRAAGRVPPRGTFVAVTDVAAVAAGHGLWNLTGTYALALAGGMLTISAVHDSAGRLHGTSTFVSAMGTTVTMPVKGCVRGTGGTVLMALALKGTDTARTVVVALALNLTLDSANRQLSGRVTGNVRTGDVTAIIDSSLTLPIPSPMDGSWTLHLDIRQTARTITGSALLRLADGVESAFVVRGRTSGSTARLSLAGAPSDPPSRAIAIAVTIIPLEGGWAILEAFSSRGYGQTLVW